jgi:hypothetical protein
MLDGRQIEREQLLVIERHSETCLIRQSEAARRAEPGIQIQALCRVLDSGFAASLRPGMT